MRTAPLISAALFVHGWASCLCGQQATVRQEQQPMRVYPFSGPDPAPIMTRSSMWGRGLRLYPYFSFDQYSTTAVEQTREVLRMENPYLNVAILPQEGGKLVMAREKSTGRDFIYHNHVRKFRQIALRGPWTSGGIELNFGIVGHGPTTATPVDYLTRENADGSVSCVVGAMDLPSRTHWRVTFTMYPDKAYLESHTLWYNPRELDQSYYVWMNASNKMTQDIEFIYPGTAFIGHDYSANERPWPRTKDGRNLARLKNHFPTDPGSFFIFGVMDDFAGGYWHDSRFGFGHWALYEDMPGQKFFRWQLSRAGAIWENLLTDHDGPYYEPQMGRLFDQNDHEFFAPYTADHWREIWFPYKEIGPMVKATPYGVLNARTTEGRLRLGFCPLQKIDQPLVVCVRGKQVYREQLQLDPMQVYRKELPLAAGPGELQVDIGNKLSYTNDPEAGVLHRPLNFRNYDVGTLSGRLQQAQRDEKGRNYQAALQGYLACLEQQPRNLLALARVAGLYCRRAEYEKALHYAGKALDFAMYDPDANYIYGVISRRRGDLLDAKETLGWAARSMKYRSAAYGQIAEIYLLQHDWDRALEYLRRSLDYNAYNIKTYQVLATTHRVRKEPDKAKQVLNEILDLDPLNHLARFEQYLLDPRPPKLRRFQSRIRSELPHETYLEIAMYYVSLGRPDDALRVLDVAPSQPAICYWQAYLLRDKSPEQSRQRLDEADRLSPFLVFPYREESLAVFQWAAETRPESWKANYYLGLVFWGLRRRDDALQALARCGRRPDYAAFYRSRAFLEEGTDAEQATKDLKTACAVGANDWRNWHHLARFYLRRGMQAEALATAEHAATRFTQSTAIKVLLARTSLAAGRYQQGLAALEHITVLPAEGQRDVHDLFARCQICLALQEIKQGRFEQAVSYLNGSKRYPERLGTGKPYRPNWRVQDRLLAMCYEKMGLPAKARHAWQRAAGRAGQSSAKRIDTLKQRLDEWYRNRLPKQSEMKSLEDLQRM